MQHRIIIVSCYRELAGVLSLCNYEEDLREAAILDYYVAGYWYCTVTALLPYLLLYDEVYIIKVCQRK